MVLHKVGKYEAEEFRIGVRTHTYLRTASCFLN